MLAIVIQVIISIQKDTSLAEIVKTALIAEKKVRKKEVVAR